METTPSAATVPKPTLYRKEPEPGGVLPELGSLFSETLSEFMDHIGPYLLAGLGFQLVAVPLTVLVVIGIYMLAMGGTLAAMLVGMILTVFAALISEALGVLVMGMSTVLSYVVLLGVVVIVLVLAGGILAPMQASLIRAVAAHQRGEQPLDFTASFSTITRDPLPVVTASLLVTLLTLLGLVMCYVPGLVMVALFAFVTHMVALHRTGALESLQLAAAHARAYPGFYVPYMLVYFVLSMVVSYVPIAGPMFAMALHVRAYRRIFGDQEALVLESQPAAL